MPNGEGEETQTESKPEETAPAGEAPEKKDEAPGEGKIDYKAELEKLKAQNEELSGVVKGAVKRASDAEAFVQNLTGRLSDIAASRDRAHGVPEPSPEELRDKLRERLSDDPMSVLEEHYRARTGPLVERFLDQQGKTNRELFITKMSMEENGRALLKDYLGEVDDFLKDFGPEHRASPDAYDAALRWVLSKPDNFNREVDRRLKSEREKAKTHFVEPATGGERAPKEVKRELSSLEKEVAAGLGLSEEEYVKYKEV